MKTLIYISFILLGFTSYGQRLTASTSEKKIKIGEPITLKYSIKTTKDAVIEFKSEKDKIEARSYISGSLSKDGAEFEITERFTDTSKILGNAKEWIGRYTVTVWDSGAFILPGPTVIIDDSTYRFKDVRVYSDYLRKKKGVDIYDIHENFTEIPDEPFTFMTVVNFIGRNWWWLTLILLVFVFYFFYRLSKKRKRAEPTKLFKAMSLKERTLLAIDALENEKMWEKDKLKEHFVELSYILRSYLTSRYNVSLLEKTTYEAKLLLTRKGLDDDTVDNIGRILSESDMVKFAKSTPEVISILRVSTLAKQIVAETSPLEFDNVE